VTAKIIHTTHRPDTDEIVVEQKATALRISRRGYPEHETIVEARSEEDGRWFTATSWCNGDTITIVTIEIEL
jgi:hypothetical protein